MATIFVTGGSGFVGKRLVKALVARGDQVRALARSTTSQEVVKRIGAEPVAGDLDDVAAMAKGMSGCSHVFHLAAAVEDFGPLEHFLRVNVKGTENVLEAAKQAKVSRLVHVSTEAVLVGGPPLIDVDETRPLPEHPLGPYPLTKGMAESRVRAANSSSLQTVVVRPRFIWGRGDTVILAAMVQAVKSGRFAWFDGGHYLTSTCHVENVVEGLLLAAEKGTPGEIYFVTDGQPVEFRAFITEMLATQQVVPGPRSLPHGLAYLFAAAAEGAWTVLPLSGRPPITRSIVRLIGEQVTVVDQKARRELGYQGRKSRAEGLKELAEDFASASASASKSASA
jgi:nucleoside-diphosphate-sugar epimerase